jgi:GNAT superfamily N-acetyltransferase
MVQVRAISRADINDFLPLVAAYQDWNGAGPTTHTKNKLFFQRFLEPSKYGIWLGASIDGSSAGFATLCWSDSSVAASDVALIEDLFVDPYYRDRGVGKALMEAGACAARARGATRLDLTVGADACTASAL